MNSFQAEKFVDDIVAGSLSEEQISIVLKEMSKRGETVEEIIGVAKGMQKYSVNLVLPPEIKLMDTCGTGGSGLQRMNISTTASFVLAAGGVHIAKHGNRSASSRCGSFDMLEKLGINIELGPEQIAEAIQKIGIGFLFTRIFHPAMKIVAPVRKQLGFPTVFNFAGPLTSPARPAYHFLGTNSKENAEKMATAMKELGFTRAMVVAGEDGLDDVTLTGKTFVFDLNRGKTRNFDFEPEDVGLPRVNFAEISGGTPDENAKTCLDLLQGKGRPGLQALLLVNSAFGFMVREMVDSVNEGMELAHEIIQSGDAYNKFTQYKKFSNISK